jgi:AraC-like DNA-binding protein/mannose-6-phosphate isomerase-like protein (cupin superfamily)
MKLTLERQSPIAATEVVACEVVRGVDFGCVWHHHPEFEITLVKRGGTERWVGDKLAALTPGDLVLLGSDLPHDFRNDRGSGRRAKKVEAIVVQFMPHLLGADWLQHPSMRPVRELFQRAQLGLEVRGATRRRATLGVIQIAKAKGLRRVALLLELLDDLARSKELREIASPGFHAAIGSASSDRLGTVLAYIEEHLTEPIYVPVLAAMSGLSESAFSRLFKSCTQRTVPQYVNELRIARACRLLAETDQTVSEIADACGYPTPAHFQRQFHRHQNRSPLVYRVAVRKQG